MNEHTPLLRSAHLEPERIDGQELDPGQRAEYTSIGHPHGDQPKARAVDAMRAKIAGRGELRRNGELRRPQICQTSPTGTRLVKNLLSTDKRSTSRSGRFFMSVFCNWFVEV